MPLVTQIERIEGQQLENRIFFLANHQDFKKALSLYYENKDSGHRPHLLMHMAKNLLNEGLQHSDIKIQLLSVFASKIAGYEKCTSLLKQALLSPYPEVQLAALHTLSNFDSEEAIETIQKAFSSNFYLVRIEACYILAQKKRLESIEQIEAFFHKAPDEVKPYFCRLFAFLGNPSSLNYLKNALISSQIDMRLQAILQSAAFQRREMIPYIKQVLTHPNFKEQEAALFALSQLKDESSIKMFEQLLDSPFENVGLMASFALYHLGQFKQAGHIEKYAKKDNLFAIHLLGQMATDPSLLKEKLLSRSAHVRFNAFLSLLERKEKGILGLLKDYLFQEEHDLGFYPIFSNGMSMQAIKVFSGLSKQIALNPHLAQSSYQTRLYLLTKAFEYDEEELLPIAEMVLKSNETQLIPIVVHMLETLKSPKAVTLLKHFQQKMGAPFVRMYCNLALFHLKEKGNYFNELKIWLEKHLDQDFIQLKATDETLSFEKKYELTPEEKSQLLIESTLLLAQSDQQGCLDLLLNAISKTKKENRYALAGLLMKALE